MNLKFISISLNKKMVLSFLTLFLTFLFVNFSYAQYSGTGTFTRITSSAQLTDGYYVITNASNTRAMSNVQATDASNQPVLLTQVITPTSGNIINPNASIVWFIKTNGSGKVIYSEASRSYVNYTGTFWGVNLLPAVSNDLQRWTFSYSGTEFIMQNVSNNTSRFTYFDSTPPDFSYYSGNNGEQNLQLYKSSIPVATDATNISSNSFTANWFALPGNPSYRLDVSTTPFDSYDIVGWTFPNNRDLPTADITSLNNTDNTLSSHASISYTGGATSEAARTNQWDGDISSTPPKYWQISVNTQGHSSLRVYAVQRSDPRGPRYFKVQYKIEGDADWTDIVGGVIDVGTDFTRGVTDLALPPECNNKPLVHIRWVKTSNITNDGRSIRSNQDYSRIDNIYVRSVNTPTYVTVYNNLNVGNVTSFNVTGLSPFTTYYYRVRAVYGTSTSPNSNVIEVKTYKDILTADFRSRANGNYNVATTWEFDSGIPEVGWVQATQPPGANNNVLIQAPHTVTMTDEVTFNSGKTLTVNGKLLTSTYTITGAGGITVPSGGVVASALSITDTDTFSSSLAVSGTIDFQTGSTFELNGTAKQYLGARTFSNLKISNTSGKSFR